MTDMDEGARRWLLKTARTNLWRVPSWVDFDDLVEDGMLVYWRVILKYEERQYVSPSGYVTNKSRRIRTRAHIQRLFQMSFHHHLNELANKRTESDEVLVRDQAADTTTWNESVVWDLIAPTPDELAHNALVSDAPSLVRRLLCVLTSEQPNPALRSAYRLLPGHRETMNDRFCRLIGVSPKEHDLVTALRDYLMDRQPLAA